MRKYNRRVLIMNKLITGVCTLVELGCMLALGGIALKRNNECYKAECKANELEVKLIFTELESYLKGSEIERLKKELEELKGEKEESQ